MRLALLLLNASVLVAVAGSIAAVRQYGYPGDWNAANVIEVFFAVPCIAALIAVRKSASGSIRTFGAGLNALWLTAFSLLGVLAATGAGGLVGLLLVIGPVLLVLSLNWRFLRRRH